MFQSKASEAVLRFFRSRSICSYLASACSLAFFNLLASLAVESLRLLCPADADEFMVEYKGVGTLSQRVQFRVWRFLVRASCFAVAVIPSGARSCAG